ncbi:MAG: hypothetical protein NTU97_03040, partial [Candidatus Magasanikbacteria bacterium]|nr:hypothetical protein [Candidatus Magasanikbacteria bacterium]
MASKWLSLFFKLSAWTFNLKEKMIKADKWYAAAFYALIIFISELAIALVSLPLYFIVSPQNLQERGIVFPTTEGEPIHFKSYIVRRKISIVTIFGAGGLFIIKVAFVAIVSFYLLGAQQLLAATQNWTFDVPTDYTTSSANVEITGGVARLKDLGSTSSGATTNSGFDTAATGWTGADWLQPTGSTATENYVSSGGNPGGYVNVRLQTSNNKNKIVAGYWYQSFTTTVASPDTATLNLDWSSLTFTAPNPLQSYKLYAFIDTGSGVPTLGTEVWSSPTITGTTSWASVTPINITAKVPTAGTYYVKVAAHMQGNASTNTTYNLITGFDNVIVNWSKTTHVYDATSPTVRPNTSLTMTKTVSWDSFSETATKNGGEVNYQLSTDDGVTWKYWTGSAWGTAGASNYNTAAVVNTNFSTFSTSSNKIMWKAFLTGNGTQQVILDNVAVTYTENTPPVVASLTPAQNTTYGYVNVGYNLQDANSDPSSLVNYEYSLTGAFTGEQVTMTASSTDPAHSGVTNLTTSPAGIAKTFVWNAKSQLGAVYNTGVYVRLRGNDGIQNGAYTTSSAITIDYVNPVISNVAATEVVGSTNVTISYDLTDNTSDNLLVELQISGDGGSTWTVPATSVTGAVGTGVTTGVSKTITWAAGTDYTGQQKSNMQVRVRAKDKWQNQGAYTASSNFALDTLNPAAATAADLQAQPLAGATTVLVGGSFTEVNPNLNDFFVAIDGGAYSASTTGSTNTATPTNQATAVGATLDGNDSIFKVKIVHTDDYSNIGTNENVNPSTAYKYVKPYTPSAPTLSSPITTRLDLQVNEAVGEATDLQYAMQETTTGNYVQSDGTLGATIVWQVLGTSSGQWGNGLGVRGKVRVTGLSSPVSQYIFKVKSRNPSDSAHAVSSESAYSATAQVPNTAPSIILNSNAQTTDGTQYVPINYTGTDGQGDISSISLYEYSQDNSTWHTMTEKAGVSSNGVSNLVFLPTGSAYLFAWNSATDLANIEDSTVYVRLRPNDSLINGSTVTSAALEIDNKLPVVASVVPAQNAGARTVAITYNLTDANNSTVELNISSDGGSTWNVATSSATGAVGAGVTPATGKTITWNAGTNFDNQYNTNMKVRVRARDTFGNQGSFAESSVFT